MQVAYKQGHRANIIVLKNNVRLKILTRFSKAYRVLYVTSNVMLTLLVDGWYLDSV